MPSGKNNIPAHKVHPIIVLCFAAIGCIALLIALVTVVSNMRFNANSFVINATVIDQGKERSGGSHIYRPIFEYEQQGQLQTATVPDWISSGNWLYAEGQTVQVRVDYDDPTIAIPTDLTIWYPALFGGGFAIAFLGVAAHSFFSTMRHRQPKRREHQPFCSSYASESVSPSSTDTSSAFTFTNQPSP